MPYSLSHSSLNLFKDCPRCFFLLLKEGKRRPSSIYPSLPYGIDKALKDRSNYYRDRGGLPPELRKLGKEVKLFDHALLGLWRKKGIRCKDDKGNMLLGMMDDILQIDDKSLILEYVTRGFALKEDTLGYYHDQLAFYTYLLHKNGYATADYAYLLFYYPKGINWRGDVWFEKKLHKVQISTQRVEKLAADAFHTLQGSIPAASSLCEYCLWKNPELMAKTQISAKSV